MQTPFFNLMELVRLICNAFDIGRSIKKKLDNESRNKFASLDEAISFFRKPEIYDDLFWIFGSKETCEQFIQKTETSFKYYLEFITTYPANGTSREKISPIIFQWFGEALIHGELSIVANSFHVSVIDENTGLTSKAIPRLLTRFSSESLSWKAMLQHLEKGKVDLVNSWAKGVHIPDLPSIKVLLSEPGMQKERTSIAMARAWDYLTKLFNQEGQSPDTWTKEERNKKLKSFNQEIARDIAHVLEPLSATRTLLNSKNFAANIIEESIKNLESSLSEIRNPCFVNYTSDQEYFDLLVKKELFKEALNIQKSILENRLYRELLGLETYLESIMQLAAATGPDRVFCKQIRKLQNTFGFKSPYNSNLSDSNKSEDHIQDWEINLYALDFHKKYNPSNIPPPKTAMGPLLVSHDDIDNIRYDYRKPDKYITIPSTGTSKKTHQLSYAVLFDHYDQFQELLKNGANVNVLNSSNESPLLLATFKMARGLPHFTYDKCFFDSLIKLPHNSATLNATTEKNRFTILHAAVQSGHPDMVKTVLDMGCDIDIIGTTDKASPLYKAIQHLKFLINPDEFLEKIRRREPTRTDDDAALRHSNGLFKSVDEQQRFSAQHKETFPPLQKFTEKHIIKNFQEIPETQWRDIVLLLIKRGADCNLEHVFPIKGYTPLMLAVENGFADIVKAMLEAGADPFKNFYSDYFKKHIDSFDLAREWKQPEVQKVLEEHKRKLDA